MGGRRGGMRDAVKINHYVQPVHLVHLGAAMTLD